MVTAIGGFSNIETRVLQGCVYLSIALVVDDIRKVTLDQPWEKKTAIAIWSASCVTGIAYLSWEPLTQLCFFLVVDVAVRVAELVQKRQVQQSEIPFFLEEMKTNRPAIGQEAELGYAENLIAMGCNIVLLGPPGIGKSHFAETLAERAKVKDSRLFGKRFFSLNYEAFVGNAIYHGQWEGRLTALLAFTKKNEVVIFSDELHKLLYSRSGGSNKTNTIANALKDKITKGEIQIIGATTEKEYREQVLSDPAFEDRFKEIYMENPSVEVCADILKSVAEKDARYAGFTFAEGVFALIAQHASEVSLDKGLPRKAQNFMLEVVCRNFDDKAITVERVDEAAEKWKQDLQRKQSKRLPTQGFVNFAPQPFPEGLANL